MVIFGALECSTCVQRNTYLRFIICGYMYALSNFSFVSLFTFYQIKMTSNNHYTEDEISSANALSDLSARFRRQASMNNDTDENGNQ